MPRLDHADDSLVVSPTVLLVSHENTIRRLHELLDSYHRLDRLQTAQLTDQQAEIDRVNRIVEDTRSTIKWAPLILLNFAASVLLCIAFWPIACLVWTLMDYAGLSVVVYLYVLVTMPLAVCAGQRFLSQTLAWFRGKIKA